MVAKINAFIEIYVNTATEEELKLIEAVKSSLHSYDPIEYKERLWYVESISWDVPTHEQTICKIVMVDVGKKKPVDFHVEVNKDLMPSQEMLDAGGGEGSKRFAKMYIKALQKNK